MIVALILFLIVLSFAIIYFSIKTILQLRLNSALFKVHLTKSDQARIEKNLSGLNKVIVLSDRVDAPSDGFYEAVSDNFRSGVTYLFLVSHRSTESDLAAYRLIFEKIEIAVRAEMDARSAVGVVHQLPTGPLSEFRRLHQEWEDYPYMCYEFFDKNSPETPQYLMYRGNQIGVGLADSYVKVSPETAYSLVKRASSLKELINDLPDNFVDGSLANLNNESLENVLQFKKAG